MASEPAVRASRASRVGRGWTVSSEAAEPVDVACCTARAAEEKYKMSGICPLWSSSDEYIYLNIL